MKNFKSALGNTNNMGASSIRTLKNNNSESLWIGGDSDEEDNFASNLNSRLGDEIIDKLQTHIFQQRTIDESTLNAVMAIYQKMHGKEHKQKLMLENLEAVVKKLLTKSSANLQPHLAKLGDFIKLRIKKISNYHPLITEKREEKRSMEYDEIAQKMFKKPQDQRKLKQNRKKVLQINLQSDFQPKNNRQIRKHDSNGNSNGTKNSGSGSQDSGDAKLGKLLSSGSYDSNADKRKEDEKQYQEEGYSFSAIMSSSIAIKQRSHPQKKIQKTAGKDEKKGQNDAGNDEAFIFYRPTKPGRK